ncbi:MAG TPA: Maf family protein [Ignavibacteriaceae bacterium]|nr:Maf family protein [Ignavibacteriaceae bacterium]
MIKTDLPIYLASRSPRRKKLLQQIKLKFKVLDIDTPEDFIKNEKPVDTCKRIALEKLEEAKKYISTGIIITADTIVVQGDKVLGKPKDEKNAFKMLNHLSGKTHFVYTGLALYNSSSDKTILSFEKTSVKFRDLTKEEIWDYIKTGSPMDKAGSYGIQDDYGAVFIEKIVGDYYNVVGLPLTNLYKNLLRII